MEPGAIHPGVWLRHKCCLGQIYRTFGLFCSTA